MMNTGVGSITEPQRKKLFAEMRRVDLTKEDIEASLKFGMSELSVQDAHDLIDCLVNNKDLSAAIGTIKERHATAKGPLDHVEEKAETAETPPEQKNEEMPKTREEALARREEKTEIQNSISGFSREEIELIKTNYAYGATDAELRLFLYIAHLRGLNPLLGEIKWVRRRKFDKVKKVWVPTSSIIIGIDGARRKAQESGKLDGIEVKAILDGKNIVAGKCTLWLKNSSHPIEVEVPFEEYCETDDEGNLKSLWKTMPQTMIKKVAEMTAYRMAFPRELAGMYIEEEMRQAGTPIKAEVVDQEAV